MRLIRLFVGESGSLEVVQNDVSPSVYLDHWALRRISGNKDLTVAFSNALRKREGTLILSMANMGDFSRVASTEQVQSAEDFVDGLLPHVFFQESDPFTVISRENALLGGAPPVAPHADMDLAGGLAHLRPNGVQPLSVTGLFDAARESKPAAAFVQLQETIVNKLKEMRDSLDTDPEFRRLVGKPPPAVPQTATRLVLAEVIRAFLVDRGTTITRNHATDFLHTVVPVSYSDVVLLDKHWATLVDRVNRRMADHGISAPIARLYSASQSGFSAFLDEFVQAGTGAVNQEF